MEKTYDTVIIGAGFYGLKIAEHLSESLGKKSVLVLEKEDDVMSRASYNNQARVHNGYHYPRSILTALRSRVNLPVFTKEYDGAIVQDFDKYYAIARNFSKVSANQFQRFFERIGAEIEVSKKGAKLFDSKLIEEVFLVKEFAFNTQILKEILISKLEKLPVDIHTSEPVYKFSKHGDLFKVETDSAVYYAKNLINTTYSSINTLHVNSDISVIPLKHELTEMCLVELPKELEGKAFTVMCGPFFSLMPFPAKNMYTMSHVRYTPHSEWWDTEGSVVDSYKELEKQKGHSNFPQMFADIKRYMPNAKDIMFSGESLWEVKTVLPQSEADDSRPIMYLKDFAGLKNYICIIGGKIDNVYDVLKELEETYEKN